VAIFKKKKKGSQGLSNGYNFAFQVAKIFPGFTSIGYGSDGENVISRGMAFGFLRLLEGRELHIVKRNTNSEYSSNFSFPSKTYKKLKVIYNI
jgi:hypothetical protein